MTNSNAPSADIERSLPLAEMSVAQIAVLPVVQLQQAQADLLTLQAMVKTVLERFHTALDQRYAEQAATERLASGKDFGVCHLIDGAVRVTVDVPKRVSWDQPRLAEIAQRIAAAGDKISDYIDTEYSVSESRYTAWPSTLKETFAKARTVKPGKTAFRLTCLENQGV